MYKIVPFTEICYDTQFRAMGRWWIKTGWGFGKSLDGKEERLFRKKQFVGIPKNIKHYVCGS